MKTAKKTKSKRTSNMSLDDFKKRLSSGHYLGPTGARRALTRMKLTEPEAKKGLAAIKRKFPKAA